MAMRQDSTRTILIYGLSAIIGLMLMMVIVSLTMLNGSYQRIEHLVSTNNIKSALIHQMRTAARERTVSLQNMLILDDPFAQDEAWMQINANGAAFADARAQLLSLPLTEKERNLLDAQARLTGTVGQLHLDIAQLILDGDTGHAKRLLQEQAIPGQQQTFELLSTLLAMQIDGATKAVRDAKEDYRRTLIAGLALVVVISVLGAQIARFITRRITAIQHDLHEATERAQVTLHSIGDAVITTDIEGRIEQMNPEAERLTGRPAAAAAEREVHTVFTALHPEAPMTVLNPIMQAMEDECAVTSGTDIVLRAADGREYAIEYTAAPIFDERHNRVTGAVLVFRDVSRIRLIADELAYQAQHDVLTGLHNRRAFEAHMQHVLERVPAHTDEPHWLCYLDLDQFKIVNDTCGHLAGDELLKQVAATLQMQLRDTDLLARMGGDEFAILLNRCTTEQAVHTTERIRHALTTVRFNWNDKSFRISGSFGLIPITPERGTLYELLSAADTACYVAKDRGRDCVHIYQSDDVAAQHHTSEMHWVHRIRQALEDDRFVLYHQPIAALQGTVYSLHSEILVRMLDEHGAIIPPLEFIPAAERYGMMRDVDRWVIRNTLDSLRTSALRMPPGSCLMAINLSAQSLCDDEFLAFVLHELERHQCDARNICFEITETCAITNLSRATRFIGTLRARGCRFALDDFGSGLSSFGYLKNLPVDYLKIDGSFVRGIDHDVMDLAMVESINQVGHVAGIQTIAEYVENTVIQERLRRMGVDFAQGYAVARPEPLNLLEQHVAQQQTRWRERR
ncbi:MAG TPA: EAL domain-containing protein [Gammaproteobacteria bacterium]